MAAKKRPSGKAGKAVAPSKGGGGRGGSAAVVRTVTSKAAGGKAKPGKKAAKKAAASKSTAGASKPRAAASKAEAGPTKKPARAAAAGTAKPVKRATSATSAAEAQPSSAGGLAEGERAPAFTLQDQRGQSVSSDELVGKPYVIYFYPKDDTPGCTTEACGFRDAGTEFEDVGVRVLGVSPDSVASHQRFVSKYGLPFTLLSDPEQVLASSYGVWALKKNYGREYMGIVRSTFLVDAEGIIRKVWRGVRVNGHVAQVQAAAGSL